MVNENYAYAMVVDSPWKTQIISGDLICPVRVDRFSQATYKNGFVLLNVVFSFSSSMGRVGR